MLDGEEVEEEESECYSFCFDSTDFLNLLLFWGRRRKMPKNHQAFQPSNLITLKHYLLQMLFATVNHEAFWEGR